MVKIPTLVQKAAQKPTELYKRLRFASAYLAFMNSGTTTDADKLERSISAFAKPEDFKQLAAELYKVPAIKEMLDNWYIPPRYTLEDLKQYKPGTLGYAYYRHMTDNGLGIDYYPVPKADDALSYFRMRAVQTHDLWHVLAGYAPVPAGEISVIYFGLGHYSRHLEHLAAGMLTVPGFIASAGLGNIITKYREVLPEALMGSSQGFKDGYNAKSLFAGQWESWFDQPLAELRQRYNIVPASTVYDFEAAPSGELAGVN